MPQKVINFDPATGNYTFYDAGSLPGSPSYPQYAPLMLCRWKERPPASAETTTICEIDVDLFEDRPTWERFPTATGSRTRPRGSGFQPRPVRVPG